MFDTTTEVGASPIIEPGSSAADAIEQALDSAQSRSELDAILFREIPYKTTIRSFDRLGRIQCRRLQGEHFDQEPVAVTITEKIATQLSNSVSTTVGASLTTTVQAGVKASVPGGESSVSTSVSGTVEASKTVVNAVQTQLSRSVGVTERLSVTYHADECFEHNNPYGLCLEITITGMLSFRQDSRIARGNDGLFHHKLLNAGVIAAMTVEDVDVSVDPCVMPDESPRRIPGCEPQRKVGARLPVETIEGVGAEFGGKLRNVGIATVGDLAEVDIDATFEDIPRNQLLAARARARMLVGMTPDATRWASLGDRPVGQVLDTPPESLGERFASADDIAATMRVQEDLATMLVSLDDSVVRDTTVSELSGKLDIVR
ncbi:hypothetical protein [Denitromonas iodatirespirans]|uniref:Uncharacterized protein n=1 Tax=Denitromonas iodatirespirans TaxID=2795389 RepID=A0A944H7J8_DENI1|nr:hypothetical protein [Denitromonas iodatirespirans]MBT0961313.1 hypothetical protein [Denitromonas iodatirespirans]